MHTALLTDLRPGDRGIVRAIAAELSTKRRLMEMGLTPGSSIQVDRIAPLGDPLELTIKGYHLSLRAHEARCIEVDRSEASGAGG